MVKGKETGGFAERISRCFDVGVFVSVVIATPPNEISVGQARISELSLHARSPGEDGVRL